MSDIKHIDKKEKISNIQDNTNEKDEKNDNQNNSDTQDNTNEKDEKNNEKFDFNIINIENIKFLKHFNMDLNKIDNEGNTLLHWICRHEIIDTILLEELLLSTNHVT